MRCSALRGDAAGLVTPGRSRPARRATRDVSLALVTTAFRLGSKGSTERVGGTAWSQGLRFFRRLGSSLCRDQRRRERGLARMGAQRWRRRACRVRYLGWVHWHFVYDLQISHQRTQSHAAQWREHRGMTK